MQTYGSGSISGLVGRRDRHACAQLPLGAYLHAHLSICAHAVAALFCVEGSAQGVQLRSQCDRVGWVRAVSSPALRVTAIAGTFILDAAQFGVSCFHPPCAQRQLLNKTTEVIRHSR
jgi:hypothetical protein